MSTLAETLPAPPAGRPALAMRSISKAFNSNPALSGVDFEARAGEVHAICGENGAGKSTLMKVLGGIYLADAGTVEIDGRPVAFAHPRAAREAGVSIVHQELSLLPHRTLADNIFLGQEPGRRGLLDRAAMRARSRALLADLGAVLDPDREAGSLSIAEQQIVEIAKALVLDARVLVMDEPTAALNEREAARLLDLVRALAKRGVAVIYVSHRMAEVMDLATHVTVLKDGRSVLSRPRADLNVADIVSAMVGRPLGDFYPPPRPRPDGPVVLSVQGGANAALRAIDLDIRAGEIVGVGGLDGSGKEALGRALFGDVPFQAGVVTGPEGPLDLASPRRAIRAGIGYLPGDRKAEGLALSQSVVDNALLTLRALGRAFRPPRRGATSNGAADSLLKRMDVRAADYGAPIERLSGGNQQKAIIARWLAQSPRLLVFVEPTRGIDVAAKAAIYAAMRQLTAEGKAILMISSDLQEVVGVSDRILVMRGGRIAGECAAGATEGEVMALAVGHDETSAEREPRP